MAQSRFDIVFILGTLLTKLWTSALIYFDLEVLGAESIVVSYNIQQKKLVELCRFRPSNDVAIAVGRVLDVSSCWQRSAGNASVRIFGASIWSSSLSGSS